MKKKIQKIIMIAAAMIFAGSGVSFAHDWNDRNKPPGKAYGHYKVKKQQPGWNNKHFKPNPHNNKRYVHKYDRHQHGTAPCENELYKIALKDPRLIFKVIVKEHR